MEGGVMRDIMTHKLTTYEHFQRQKQPGAYTGMSTLLPLKPHHSNFSLPTESGKAFETMVGNQTVQPELDDHCVIDLPNGACQPGKCVLNCIHALMV